MTVSILLELKTQITVIAELHEQDQADRYDGLFLDDAGEGTENPAGLLILDIT